MIFNKRCTDNGIIKDNDAIQLESTINNNGIKNSKLFQGG